VEFDNYYEMETILGGSADDNLSFTNGDYPQGAARNFLLVGNGGNDRIVVGNWTRRDRRSHIAVRGGSGNDSIYAWGATVQVWGESGDDALYLRDSDNTSVTADLGSGFDSTELTSNDSIVAPHFTIPPGCERFRGLGNMTVTGNDLDNVIVLNAWPPTTMQVFGMGGNDLITFQRGRGAGTLTADGGAGNDTILGGDDNDSIRGGSGNDHIEAFDGNDTIFGDDGNDTLLGQKGNDQIHAGAGDDSVWGGTGNDSLWGDAGHDKLFGENDNDTLFAKDGTTDTLDGGSGTDKAQRDNSSTIKDSVLNVESYI
jgi:Ca2+-binding RTX toxin-like protein